MRSPAPWCIALLALGSCAPAGGDLDAGPQDAGLAGDVRDGGFDDGGRDRGDDGGADPLTGTDCRRGAAAGEPCWVRGGGRDLDTCAAGLHCFNPLYDEGGDACIGVCRAQGDECASPVECSSDGGGEMICDHGWCEPGFG